MDVLAAADVRKTFGDTVALDGVSLSVAEGEVFALIGPNGAGKTTLVRTLTGTTTPDSGEVQVFDAPPVSVDTARLGLLPQAFGPPDRLTPRELVTYYAGLYDDARDPDDVLAEVGLDADDDTWYADLSGGQQRRVCVATALVNDPDLLFLDEPTTGIDPAGRQSLWRLLEDLADAGTTIFLTTHYMEEAERLADRVGLLADGRLVEVGTPSSLVATHGGDTRLEVEADADPERLTDTGFTVVRENGRLVFEGVTPADIGDVVRALDDHGVAFDALTWTEPDLEDVFLNVTGEELSATVGGDRQ